MSSKAAQIGIGVVMVDPESKLFCSLDSSTPAIREQQRLKALAELGLLEADTVPVFEEATQTAARFLGTPICILGLMEQDQELIKSAVGLSRVGLMNELAASRQLPRGESLCTYVVDSGQVLAIDDTAIHPAFAKTLLVQHYGIRAYLGAPLLTASGHCLGTLAVMDLVPRTFTSKDIDFLAIMARWVLCEFERNHLLKAGGIKKQVEAGLPHPHKIPSSLQLQNGNSDKSDSPSRNFNTLTGSTGQAFATSPKGFSLSPMANGAIIPKEPSPHIVKAKLLAQLSQELRTPLTSVMGMTSVLSREIYGPLSSKQKEYLDIIHCSGKHLISLVDEILALGVLDENSQKLHLTSVDIEMLSQQAINSLEQVAKQRKQQIKLSVEPGNRIWLLDKDKVRSMLYYLVFSLIQSSEAECEVRIHVSRKSERLNIAIWVSHPWLGNCLPSIELHSQSEICQLSKDSELLPDINPNDKSPESCLPLGNQVSSITPLLSALASSEALKGTSADNNNSRESLGLLLSCGLAKIHGGQISVQGSPELGYRYVVSLPQVAIADERY